MDVIYLRLRACTSSGLTGGKYCYQPARFILDQHWTAELLLLMIGGRYVCPLAVRGESRLGTLAGPAVR